MKEVTLETLSSPGCHVCEEFEKLWESVRADNPEVKYRNISVVTPEGMELARKYGIFSSPGIIINGELFSMGGFDRGKFLAKLKELSK